MHYKYNFKRCICYSTVPLFHSYYIPLVLCSVVHVLRNWQDVYAVQPVCLLIYINFSALHSQNRFLSKLTFVAYWFRIVQIYQHSSWLMISWGHQCLLSPVVSCRAVLCFIYLCTTCWGALCWLLWNLSIFT